MEFEPLWINVWVACKSVWSLVYTCHTWAPWRWVHCNSYTNVLFLRGRMACEGLQATCKEKLAYEVTHFTLRITKLGAARHTQRRSYSVSNTTLFDLFTADVRTLKPRLHDTTCCQTGCQTNWLCRVNGVSTYCCGWLTSWISSLSAASSRVHACSNTATTLRTADWENIDKIISDYNNFIVTVITQWSHCTFTTNSYRKKL